MKIKSLRAERDRERQKIKWEGRDWIREGTRGQSECPSGGRCEKMRWRNQMAGRRMERV